MKDLRGSFNDARDYSDKPIFEKHPTNKHEIIAKFKELIDQQDEDALAAFDSKVWKDSMHGVLILSIYTNDENKIVVDIDS